MTSRKPANSHVPEAFRTAGRVVVVVLVVVTMVGVVLVLVDVVGVMTRGQGRGHDRDAHLQPFPSTLPEDESPALRTRAVGLSRRHWFVAPPQRRRHLRAMPAWTGGIAESKSRESSTTDKAVRMAAR